MSIDCTLVTCEAIPSLDPDDLLLSAELRRRGLTVAAAVWSDPNVDWLSSRLCVLRSTWYYHSRYGEFVRWLSQVSKSTTLRNDPRLVRWNVHKGYLRQLGSRGVPIVPTVWVARGQRRDLSGICEMNRWSNCVIKPARGAATHNVMFVKHDASSRSKGQVHLDHLIQADDALVQPYLEAVATYGERALVFLSGRYSHAVVKKPFDTVLAVGDAGTAAIEATHEEVDVASLALSIVPGEPLYARVDLLRDEQGRSRVSEVELIEPALYFGASANAVAACAEAIERELEGAWQGTTGDRLVIRG